MNWHQARAAAISGKAIRRIGWLDRWISYAEFLWWLTPVDVRRPAAPHVVDAPDFTAAEFRATDWTTDPPPPPAFPGFQNPGNKYGSLTLYDWDSCLFGAGIASGETTFIPGIGVVDQPPWPVDGHTRYVCINAISAIGVEGTGDDAVNVGVIVAIADLLAAVGVPQSDVYAFSNIINPFCNNADGSKLFLVLGDPSPDNA